MKIVIIVFVLISFFISCSPVAEYDDQSTEVYTDDNEQSLTMDSEIVSESKVMMRSQTLEKTGETISGIGSAFKFSGDNNMVKPSIAVDSKGGLHILASEGLGNVYIYHISINKNVTSQLLARTTDMSSVGSEIYSRRIVIDTQDRAWVNVGFYRGNVYPACGQIIYKIDNIDERSSINLLKKEMYTTNFRFGWFGNVALDHTRLGQVALIGLGGLINRISANGSILEETYLPLNSSGEKIALEITKDGVFHGVMSGYYKVSGTYTNSSLGKSVVWASRTRYPKMGDDVRWPGIGVDNSNDKAAYMAGAIGGNNKKYMVLNVWNGSRMLFPTNKLYTLDYVSEAGNGTNRFAPSFASAKRSGAYMCWTAWQNNQSVIRIKYLSYKGQSYFKRSQMVDYGSQCAITTDASGDIHLVYKAQGGLVYRKLITK